MTSTVSAMFDRYSDAKAAINRLEAAGIPHDNISIVSNDAEHRQHHGTTTPPAPAPARVPRSAR